jgi:hypothetical protein
LWVLQNLLSNIGASLGTSDHLPVLWVLQYLLSNIRGSIRLQAISPAALVLLFYVYWGFNMYFKPHFQYCGYFRTFFPILKLQLVLPTIFTAFLVLQNLLPNIRASIGTSDHLSSIVGTSEPSFQY